MREHRWHEIGLLVVCLIFSVLYFIGPPLPTQATMSGWVWLLFYGAQGVGGVVGLFGMLWPRLAVEVAFKLEQAGLLLIASAGVVYASAVFVLTGGGYRIVPIESLVLIMWVGASLARVWQIRGQLKQLAELRRTRNGEP